MQRRRSICGPNARVCGRPAARRRDSTRSASRQTKIPRATFICTSSAGSRRTTRRPVWRSSSGWTRRAVEVEAAYGSDFWRRSTLSSDRRAARADRNSNPRQRPQAALPAASGPDSRRTHAAREAVYLCQNENDNFAESFLSLSRSMILNLAPVAYGADRSGLICGFGFSSGEAGVSLDTDTVGDWLARATATQAGDGEFLWLHFNLAHASSERWMRTHLDLPESFYEALREGSHSTRIEHQHGALLAVVNDVMFDFEQTPSEIATLWAYPHQPILVTPPMTPLPS